MLLEHKISLHLHLEPLTIPNNTQTKTRLIQINPRRAKQKNWRIYYSETWEGRTSRPHTSRGKRAKLGPGARRGMEEAESAYSTRQKRPLHPTRRDMATTTNETSEATKEERESEGGPRPRKRTPVGCGRVTTRTNAVCLLHWRIDQYSNKKSVVVCKVSHTYRRCKSRWIQVKKKVRSVRKHWIFILDIFLFFQ